MEFLWANLIWTSPYRLPQCPERFFLSGPPREDSVGCSLWAPWHVCWGKASLNTQHIVPWSRLATAEKTTPCQSCQLTTGNWDCHSHWLIKIEQQKSENVARLSLNFCCNIWTATTWKHRSILPCINKSGWLWWHSGEGGFSCYTLSFWVMTGLESHN